MNKLHVFTKRGSAHKSEQEMRPRLTSGLGLERGIKKLEERRSQKESVRQKGELKRNVLVHGPKSFYFVYFQVFYTRLLW